MANICFASVRYFGNTVGGTEVQTFLMARGLAESGYRTSYATPDIAESHTHRGVNLVPIPGSADSGQCRFADFERALDSASPDLVIQVGRNQLTEHTARYCASRGVPFVFRVSSEISCRRFREIPRIFGEYPLGKAANPARMARALALDWRTFRAMKRAAVIIAQTKVQQAMLQRAFDQEVVHFENLHEVPAEEAIVKDETPMVLWLASMKSTKRPGLFLEMCKRLSGSGCRVVMAGRMNEERFREDIERLAASGELEYIENVSFEESNALLARARVFVLTSKYEGMPNTLIQAWLRRTPTVSLGVDPDGMIRSNGLGAHAGTLDEAVAAIEALLRDPATCDRAGDRARQFAIERFGMEAQVERLQGVVEKALHAG